jgi:hypothetical protein
MLGTDELVAEGAGVSGAVGGVLMGDFIVSIWWTG